MLLQAVYHILLLLALRLKLMHLHPSQAPLHLFALNKHLSLFLAHYDLLLTVQRKFVCRQLDRICELPAHCSGIESRASTGAFITKVPSSDLEPIDFSISQKDHSKAARYPFVQCAAVKFINLLNSKFGSKL